MPPRTIHVFLSYTRREEEVRQFQAVTDVYCRLLLDWARTHGVDVFYDRSSIPQDVKYSDSDLEAMIRPAVCRSHLFVSFLSPEYVDSRWCRFEYTTKWEDAPRQIHKVYWKPEIVLPFFRSLAKILRPERTRFLRILNWDQIRPAGHDTGRHSPMMEWLLADDPERRNFTDVTDVYEKGPGAGPGSVVRCAQTSAEILCREHPDLFGEFKDYGFFRV